MAGDFVSVIKPTTKSSGELEVAGARQPIPVLPVRDTVLFPHAVLPLTVGRERSVQLINSLGDDKTIIVVAQREARVDSPQPTDLFTVGSLAVVHKVVRMPNQSLFVFAEGLERVKVTEYAQLTLFFSSRRRHTRCLSDWSSDVCSSDLNNWSTELMRLLHRTRAQVPNR